MSDFKVSVIIPVYNSANYLKRAVESCIIQPQTGEIIIIDDGSTDKSLEIAHKLKQKYILIKVLQHPDKQNHGRSESRNLGIINANFDFIAFLDSDDWYLPNRFENEERIFTGNDKIDGIYGVTEAFFLDNNARNKFLKRYKSCQTKVNNNIDSKILYKTFLTDNYGCWQTNAITLRKRVFNKSGVFDKRFIIMQDTHLWCKIAAKCTLVSNNSDKAIAIRYVHKTNSILTSSDQMRQKMLKLVQQDLLIWALKQKDFNYDKKNDFFIGYKKLFPQKKEIEVYLSVIFKHLTLIFNSFTWRKLIQILKY